MSYQSTTVIRDFANYNPTQLEQTRVALALNMPTSALTACAAYYKKLSPKRDPILTELRLLDALATLEPQPDQIAIRELFTNDAFVAETYADMMNKRRALCPNAQSPVTVGEAFRLASDYLNRIGKKVAAPASGIAQQAPAGTSSVMAAQNAPALLVGESAPAPVAGDLFLLIHPAGLPEWSYQSILNELLTDGAIRTSFKRLEPVTEAGLLPLILKMTAGAFIALDRLQAADEAPAMEILVGRFADCRLALIPADRREATVELLKKAGLGVSVIGSITPDARISIALSQGSAPLAIDSAFLRSFLLRAPATAKLPSEDAALDPDVAHTATRQPITAYVRACAADSECVSVGETAIAASHAQGDGLGFRSALISSVAPLLSLSASGGCYTDTAIAAKLSLPALTPTDSNRLGEVMSVILGFYRAQTETGTPAAELSVEAVNGLAHPTLTVFSLSKAQALPATFTEAGSSLYCVAVPMDENGLPRFEALRQMLKTVSDLGSRGVLKAARVICNQTVYAALEAMRQNQLGYAFAEEKPPVGTALSLALVLESAEALPFAKIGCVVEDQNTCACSDDEIDFPALYNSLTFNGKTEAVVLSNADDADAVALAALLRQRSVKVTLAPINADAVEIARSILTAQAVFLCNVSLPESPSVDFALRALAASGGVLIGLGASATIPELPNTILQMHGISEKALDELLKKQAE